MQLYLIRHAESENNARPGYQRAEDPPLTARGRLQAGHLAEWVTTLKIDVLITSPVLRALQTTRRINGSTGHHVQVWADVYEEGGIYPGYGPKATTGGPGLRRSDVIRHATDDASGCTLDDSITESGWWNGRDRETPEQAIARAVAVTARLVELFGSRGEAIVAVIHADFKRKLLAHMLGTAIDARDFGALRNTGITKLNYDGERWQLDWFNSVSHLPAKLITGTET
jgi:2,3-bisphosphoglycerate-dependent phosphoglycerate mutase